MLLSLFAAAEEPAPEPPHEDRPGWFQQIRYAVGVSSQLGGGTDGTVFGRGVALEPVAFELRSFLWPRFAFHTTLNLGRMIVPAVTLRDGRIDYDCHLGGHVPLGERHTFVVAPGAAIAYSFSRSGYQRIMGDARLGVDFEHGAWSTGLYLRPYGGWWRDVGEDQGRATGGLLFEIVNVVRVPKRSD